MWIMRCMQCENLQHCIWYFGASSLRDFHVLAKYSQVVFFFCCCCKFWDIQSLHHTCKNERNVECNQLMMPVAIFRSRLLITAYAAINIVLLCLKVLTNYTKRVHVQQELKGRGGRTCLLLPCTGWEKDRERERDSNWCLKFDIFHMMRAHLRETSNLSLINSMSLENLQWYLENRPLQCV